MHSGLKRLQQAQALHFVTFSCFHRLPVLQAPGAMETVEAVLEQTRARHQARVYAYVLMPEHGIRPSKATLFRELLACWSGFMRDTRVVVERRRRSQAEAASLVREFEQSGLSRKAFSIARGIALHTLDYYRGRDRTRRATHTAQELLPVDLISAPSASSSLRVELASGRRIVVEAGFDVSVLKQLVAALEG